MDLVFKHLDYQATVKITYASF